MPSPESPRDSRSHRTRDAIIRAAEEQFARHGVEAVSLNTITRAAGQNNRNAIQYHFGGKTELLQAIFDKHAPGLARRRAQVIDELQQQNLSTEVMIAKAMVYPLVEKLDDPDGGEAYIHISAELITTNTLGYTLPGKHNLTLVRESKIAQLVSREVEHLPRAVLDQRVLLMNGLAYHGISDHARVRRNPSYSGLIVDTDFMVSNLIDSIAALLAAPPSQETLKILASRQS